MSTDRDTWQSIKDRLLEALDEHTVKTWFDSAVLESFQDGTLTIGVPSQFFADWLRDHYLAEIQEATSSVDHPCKKVVFKIDGRLNCQQQASLLYEDTPQGQTVERTQPKPNQPAHRKLATFEEFAEGGGNRLAKAAALEVALAESCPYPMVVFLGDPGVGKTHLLQAICAAARQRVANQPDRGRLILTSAENFTNSFMAALRTKAVDVFRERWRKLGLLLIDEIQFIAGKTATQEEFFHTINAIHERNGMVVVTCDQAPSKVANLERRLQSRLMQGLVLEIAPPEKETRLAIATTIANQSGFKFEPEVLEMVANCVSPDVRLVQGAMSKLALCARLDGGHVTLELARQALRGLVNLKGTKAVTIDLVIETVAKQFGLTVTELYGKRRDQRVIAPRQLAMYLCHKLISSATLTDIGQKFRRDHTTVLYACQAVEKKHPPGASLPGTSIVEQLEQAILSD